MSFSWSRQLTIFIVGMGMNGCAAPLRTDLPALSFSCPAPGVETVVSRSDGSRHRTKWLGSDPSDRMVCDSTNGSGSKSVQRMFGRWDLIAVAGTTEEKAAFRAAMDGLMSGRSSTAGFILRSASGEQISQQWRISGGETLDIGGVPVEIVIFTVGYVNAGNGRPWANTLWFAPKYNLFVKSDGSLDIPKSYTWQVVKIIAPAQSNPG